MDATPIAGRNMDFSDALAAMRRGERVDRTAWPFEGFAVLMPELRLPAFNHQEPGPKVNDRTAQHIGKDTPLNSRPYFALWNDVTGEWQPGWTPSTADLLATDWFIVS